MYYELLKAIISRIYGLNLAYIYVKLDEPNKRHVSSCKTGTTHHHVMIYVKSIKEREGRETT